jgi:hypothetical protein
LNTIVVQYFHGNDDSAFSVTWSGPGIIGEQVISGDSLSYARHIINSPITVQIYPGVVNNKTSSAVSVVTNPTTTVPQLKGLSRCVAMQQCAFIIQARDTHGNNIYNWGGGQNKWSISITGFNDWAGYQGTFSRINDVNYTSVQTVTAAVVPKDNSWSLVSNGNVSFGNNWLYIFGSGSQLNFGDTKSIRVSKKLFSLHLFLPKHCLT